MLSVDSMLVYRGMDIGTAKPSLADRQSIPHHMIDIVDPAEEFDAALFLKQCRQIISSSNTPLIIVGGTPFYLHHLFNPLANITVLPGLENILEHWDGDKLHQTLQKLDPERAAQIHTNDRYRCTRALCIILSTGCKASHYRPLVAGPPSSLVMVAMSMDRETLHHRIQQRVDNMFAAGLLAEATKLHGQPLSRSARAAVGYKELYDYLDGSCSLALAREKIITHTRRLLKHQFTWLRKMPVRWFDVSYNNQTPIIDAWEKMIHSQPR